MVGIGLTGTLPSTFMALAASVSRVTGADILARLPSHKQADVLDNLCRSLRDTHNPPRNFMVPLDRRIESLRRGRFRKPGPALMRSLTRFEPSLWVSLHEFLQQDRAKLIERFIQSEQSYEEKRKHAQKWAFKNVDLITYFASQDPQQRPKQMPLSARFQRGLIELITQYAPQQETLLEEAMELSTELFVNYVATDMVLRDLKAKTRHDPLTACLTRNAFKDELFAKFRRRHETQKRSRRPKSYADWVMMADIDHFKQINDTYGHHVGDQVLEAMGYRLLSASSKRDMVSRHGGEEFRLYIPGTVGRTENRGVQMAKKLRRVIAADPIRVIDKDGHYRRIRVTVSIGVARYFDPEWSEQLRTDVLAALTEATARADAALYEAKRSGRNRVVIAAAPAPETPKAE